jgi:hypothetical protein
MKLIILMIMVITPALAEQMSDCLKIQNQNDKNYCMAIYSGSATYCDKVIGYEKRRECMRKVIAKQRIQR